MVQPKVRRAVSLLAFTSFLALAPVAQARAAALGATPETGVAAWIEAEIVTLWETVRVLLPDVGPRMDDNG